MKVMAFNARPDERAFFDQFSQSLDMDLTLQKDTLTLDNVALTRGYDGISCTCDLCLLYTSPSPRDLIGARMPGCA